MPGKLNIVVISPFLPIKGGIAHFSSRLKAGLESEGVMVNGLSFKRIYPSFLTAGRPFFEPGTLLADSSEEPLLIDPLNPLTWFAARRELAHKAPDLVLLAYWNVILVPFYLFLEKTCGLKTVFLMHNFSSHERVPFDRVLCRLMLRHADATVTLSGSVHDEVLLHAPFLRSCRLYHPSAEPLQDGERPKSKHDARVEMGLDSDGPWLLFFGYIRPYKGLDMLLKALALLRGRSARVRLLVAGEFHQPEHGFRRLTRELGIGDIVRFMPGFASQSLAASCFRAADVVVLPYLKATQSGVIQQAYGYDRPVVVTPVGGLREDVIDGETGIVARHCDACSLAHAIERSLSPGFYRTAAPAIAGYRRTHSWAGLSRSLKLFLEEVAAP